MNKKINQQIPGSSYIMKWSNDYNIPIYLSTEQKWNMC